MQKKLKTVHKILLGILVVAILLVGAFLLYVSDYYHAAVDSQERAMFSDIRVLDANEALIADPGNAKTALILYPGGKVDHRAYEMLALRIAQAGILCIVPKMPFNLAVFGINRAERFIAAHPEIEHWYVGGHSLGGSMAAGFAARHVPMVDGLVLLASYAVDDISSLPLKVLSITAGNDTVLSRESYEKYKKNLPEGVTELVIEGGNHAGFASYGAQKGDGTATLTAAEQQAAVAEAVAAFCLER
ncbi:MAG: alpha/beta hydrolase [Sphaerochaeta associata]|uniref:alpha/beta hydrolase n=1 Tax=Sphaerochaeta associata TaxID=1129264 RepID=UPI002B211113|nr:alpha/beta hydrolase [Sphaerochaeta associata]MEA5107741.1 alpha/beta hydrolase [Sphaerochaeta associata]